MYNISTLLVDLVFGVEKESQLHVPPKFGWQ